MPRYGQSYGGGDFYDGPGALESLVGSLLDTRADLSAKKRQQQLEDEARAQREADRAAVAADRDRTRALEAVRLKDEGIVENPAELGGGFVRIPGASRAEQADIGKQAGQVAERQRAERAAALVGRLLMAKPEERAAIFAELSQTNPDLAVQTSGALKAPEPIKKPWEREGFTSESEYLASKRREAAATRFSDGTARGTWTIREDPKTGKTYRVNATTGQVIPFDGLPASTPTNKPATQGERTAAALYKIGMNAIKNLEGDLASGTAPLEVPGQVGRFIAGRRQASEESGGASIAGFLQSANDQKFYDASTELAMAAQYALSGKAVTRVEGQKLAAQITPQFGDSDQVVQQKLARRREWIDAVKEMGGRAIVDDAPDPLDDEYNQLAGRTTP